MNCSMGMDFEKTVFDFALASVKAGVHGTVRRRLVTFALSKLHVHDS